MRMTGDEDPTEEFGVDEKTKKLMEKADEMGDRGSPSHRKVRLARAVTAGLLSAPERTGYAECIRRSFSGSDTAKV